MSQRRPRSRRPLGANVDAEHALLRGPGLEAGEVKQETWGRDALFTDSDGNGWILRQPP